VITEQLDTRGDDGGNVLPGRSRIGIGIAQVIGAWIFGRIIVTARTPAAFFSFSPKRWYFWDAFNYLNIRDHGRTFGVCGTRGFPLSIVPFAHWCGSAGWLPGFSYAIKLASPPGFVAARSSVIIPSLFLLAALAIVWLGWTREVSLWKSFTVLLLISVFPGAIYNYAPYPTSLALLGIMVAAFAALRNRPLFIGLGVAIAVVSYSTAVFAALALIAAITIAQWDLGWKEMAKRAAWGLAGFCSLAALAVHDQIVFHHWNAYSLIQSEAHPNFELPGVQTFDLVFRHSTEPQILVGHTGAIIMAVQAVLAIAVILAACAIGFWRWWRVGRSPMDLYPAAIGLGVLLYIVSSGTGSVWHRGVVLAAPCALAFRHVPPWVTAILVCAVSVVTALMSAYYFKGNLA
jgi:hypothetical protein